jgi:hypothetical protein
MTIAPLGDRPLRRGDTVAFCPVETGKLIVHRIVQTRPNGYMVRGDNADCPDGWIVPSEILGRVTRVERGGKRARLGLGPERRIVAFLSRRGSLRPLVSGARALLRRTRRDP